MRLFTLFAYLKTKESYDRWITRRVWGFKQQISKAKYLKMSVGNIRKLQENTAALYTERKTLRVSAIRGSGYVWPEKLKRHPLPSSWKIIRMWKSDQRIQTCLTGVVETSSSPIRMWDILRRKAIRINSIRIPPGGRSYVARGDRLRVQGVGTPLPDDTERARLSGSTLSGFPKRTCGALPYPDSFREKHTALVNITPRR